jgi:hypothetical protein
VREVSQKSLENEVQNTLQQIEIAHLGIRHKKCAGDGNASIGDLFGYGYNEPMTNADEGREAGGERRALVSAEDADASI